MTLPARLLPHDIVDQVAREVALEVKAHIEHMYPAAADAIAWDSASRSITGLIRNTMNAAGRAAEHGIFEQWQANRRANRRRLRALRKRLGLLNECEK